MLIAIKWKFIIVYIKSNVLNLEVLFDPFK